MSRCFPYPPPGYVKNGISDEALIESIKLQREQEKTKKGGKKDQREEEKAKKERKKEKKEKKARNHGVEESKKHRHKKRHRDERSRDDQKGRDCQKGKDNETEHFEKSSLTEDHGQPAGSQNSSDSTLNSNKRQKPSLPADSRQNSGSIIRIRLPLQRHKDPEVLPNKDQPFCDLGRTDDASLQRMHEPASVPGREEGGHSCSTSRYTSQELTSRLSQKRLSPSPEDSKIFEYQAKSGLSLNLCGSCPPPLALKFKDLIESWIPPVVPSDYTDFDNQDWLFETQQKQTQNQLPGDDRCDAGNAASNHGNSIAWPRACHVPEADIHVLPFTVPF